ncbi:MAG: transglycosylase SLT domain-containing protein, partial [Elusimicrobiota bacterium]
MSAKGTMPGFLAALLLAGAADAGLGQTVRVVLTLPAEKDEAVRRKAAAAQGEISALLAPGALGSVVRLPADQGIERERWEFSADGWTPLLSAEDRAARMREMSSQWGPAIRFEEAAPADPGLSAAFAPVPSEARRVDAAGFGAVLAGAFPSSMLEGSGAAFDGAVPGSVGASPSAGPLAGSESAGPPPEPAAGADAQAPLEAPPPPSPSLPGPPTPFDAMIVEEAKAAGMDPGVVKALIAAKGGFREDAGRASGGSYGLMLVSKGAAAGVGMKGADLKDPRNNIRAGSLILAKLFKTFGGDLHRALAAYQVGPGKVIKSGGIPNDPEVRFLLAQYERAYRHGSPKPGVKPVEAPGSPNLRRAKEEAGRKAEEIKESLSRAKYPVARYRKVIERVAAKRGADPDLIEAVMRAENPWADPMLVSRAGA